MDMFLIVPNWHWVDEVGLPKEEKFGFNYSFFILTDNYSLVEVYGYDEDNKSFYHNFGLGGGVVDEESVIAWAYFSDTSLIDKDTFYERYGVSRDITLEDLKKYDLIYRSDIEKENFLNRFLNSNKQAKIERHNSRFKTLLERDNTNDGDSERKALFWLLSGNLDLYEKVDYIYDFEDNMIKTECFEKVDFSSGARSLVRLAFNLYNSSNIENADVMSVLSSLDSDNFELAMQSIRIRFNRV